MSSPTQISGNRVLLHEPTPAWQQSGGQAINEGPEILVHNGRTFLVYCKTICLLYEWPICSRIMHSCCRLLDLCILPRFHGH